MRLIISNDQPSNEQTNNYSWMWAGQSTKIVFVITRIRFVYGTRSINLRYGRDFVRFYMLYIREKTQELAGDPSLIRIEVQNLDTTTLDLSGASETETEDCPLGT